jgi:two-component system response regulator RegX3
MAHERILLIEDDPAIVAGLELNLSLEGYQVVSASDGERGLRIASETPPDLVLLDIMLPGMDGYAICDAIRESDRRQPVIMLTARTSDEEIINGLKHGADDYVGKPFSVQQLLLRIEAVLRRSVSGQQQQRTLRLGALSIDTENLSGTRGDQKLTFTRREIDLLTHLAANSTRPVPREELLLKVWGYARNLDIETRTVDIHIAKLRRKIEPDPKEPVHLVTVRGAGYRLVTGD